MSKTYTIIGGGPSGMTLAWYLSKKYKCILIEKTSELGGCHRVKRVNGYFTEHSPRIYSSSYVNFKQLLKDMGIQFNDIFTPYEFSMTEIGGKTIFEILSLKEIFYFGILYLLLIIYPNFGKNISVQTCLNTLQFSEKSKDYIDRLCILTDGAKSNQYTLYQFLQLVNQELPHKLYQPSIANDKKLIPEWTQALEKNGVDIRLNQKVINIMNNKLLIQSKNSGVYSLITDNIIIAIPPKEMLEFPINILNSFYPNFLKWEQQHEYFNYISLTFHWKIRIKLPRVWGFPKSRWGVAFIILSDYLRDYLREEKTLISIAITKTDINGIYINKIANKCDENEIFKEVYEQLKESFGDFPYPDIAIMDPYTYYDFKKQKWIMGDSAYIRTIYNPKHIPFESNLYPNIYNVGTQNGFSSYAFTSIESAVSNSISFVQTQGIKVSKQILITINKIIYIIIIIFICLKLIKKGKYFN